MIDKTNSRSRILKNDRQIILDKWHGACGTPRASCREKNLPRLSITLTRQVFIWYYLIPYLIYYPRPLLVTIFFFTRFGDTGKGMEGTFKSNRP